MKNSYAPASFTGRVDLGHNAHNSEQTYITQGDNGGTITTSTAIPRPTPTVLEGVRKHPHALVDLLGVASEMDGGGK